MIELKKIDHVRLVKWLLRNGWTCESHAKDHAVYLHPMPLDPEDIAEVYVPFDKTYSGFARRMNEALENLTAVTGKDAETIIGESLLVGEDVLRIHATGGGIGYGAISVDDGVVLCNSARMMLEAAACSTCEPRGSFRNRRPQAAAEFMKTVRMLSPRAGSFIVSLSAPIILSESPGETPFSRRAMSMLARGLMSAKEAGAEAVMTGNMDAFGNSIQNGVSANLCAAISQIFDSQGIDQADISFGWDASIDQVPQVNSEIRFSREEATALKDGSAALQRRESTVEPFTLKGCICQLKANPGADEYEDVTLFTQIEGSQKRVTFRLPRSGNAYRKANDAHRDGRIVTVTGTLSVSPGGRLSISDVHSFDVMNDDSD